MTPNTERFHYIGPFVLVQRRCEIPPMKIIATLELSTLATLNNPEAASKFWDDLDASGKLKNALLPVLGFREKPDTGPEKDFTLEQVWDMTTAQDRAEIIADFFALNFSGAHLGALKGLG